MADESQAVHSFEKKSVEEVRAALTTPSGRRYLDLRVFFEADPGQWLPTKKGITVATELLPELEEAVRRLRAAVDAEANAGSAAATTRRSAA